MSGKPDTHDNGAPSVTGVALARIERMGTLARLVFIQPKRITGGVTYLEECLHLLVPTAILDDIAAQCAHGGVDITAASTEVGARLN